MKPDERLDLLVQITNSLRLSIEALRESIDEHEKHLAAHDRHLEALQHAVLRSVA